MKRAGDKPHSIEFLAVMRGGSIAMLEEASTHLELMKDDKLNQGEIAKIRKLAVSHLELSRLCHVQMRSWRNDEAISNYADIVKLIEENLTKIIEISKEILQSSARLL
jgi:hypothetical protein